MKRCIYNYLYKLIMYNNSIWKPMHVIIEPTENKGGLYLGNIEAAEEVDELLKHNIGAVLTIAQGANYTQYPKEFVEFNLYLSIKKIKYQAKLYLEADDTP